MSEINQEPTLELEELIMLDALLSEMQAEGIKTLSAEEIRSQFLKSYDAILTRDYNCGLRANRERKTNIAKIWTTNNLDNPEHPIAKKFRFRKFSF